MRTSKNISYQSKNFVDRRRQRLFVVVVLIFVAIVAWVFVLSRLTNVNALSIHDIVIVGTDTTISKEAKQVASRELEGKYLGLFYKDNIFVFPRKSIMQGIINISPKIATVKIQRYGWQAISIIITEKSPQAIVCAGLPDEMNAWFVSEYRGACYWADENGFVYEKTSSKNETKYNKYFIPDIDVLVGDSFQAKFATSTQEFVLLQDFYDEIRKNGIYPQAILMKDNREYELYILNPNHSFASDEKSLAVVYFNTSNSLSEQASNLVSFWKSMLDKTRSSGENISFEHIDIRYGSNVSYRKNQ